jgi:gluconokinase
MRYGYGAAELDPRVLQVAVRAALASFKSRPFDVVARCAFWHGLIGLDTNRRPITPIYTWADSRCASDAAKLRMEFSEEEVLQRSGCMLRFPFWPAKLRWLRRTNRPLFSRVRFWVSPSDWLMHDQFGELATSQSMASATGLFDQTGRCWDSAMCDGLGIKESALPPIHYSLKEDDRVLTAIGDGAAGNIGSSATGEDIAAINLGTSAAVRVMTRRRLPIPSGLFRFVVSEQTFVLGGAISNAGNLHSWCQREFQIPHSPGLQRSCAASDKLIALPFFVTERAPDWPEIPAAVFGLNPATTRLGICRALITSALYRIADIFDSLEQSVGQIDRIIISGGMSRSRSVPGILADVLGRHLEIATETEASLRGAALYALAKGEDFRPAEKKGRMVRFNKVFVRLHRARRENSTCLTNALSPLRFFESRTSDRKLQGNRLPVHRGKLTDSLQRPDYWFIGGLARASRALRFLCEFKGSRHSSARRTL